MKDSLRQMMESITRLTRAGKLREATAAIQTALGGKPPGMSSSASVPPSPPAAHAEADVIDVEARVIPDREVAPAPGVTAAYAFAPGDADVEVEIEPPPVVDRIVERVVEPAHTTIGNFIDGSFTNTAGTRPYKLYMPAGKRDGARPLIVMLHGCKQNPGDFAAGTQMNELAEVQGWYVLYPGQQKTANQWGCWNWFQEADQQRGRGEPSIIADMTRRVIAECGIDARRVYVAGLSAGGAMAAIMATTYPELFAAAGIHSGLPHAAADDLVSALRAMKQGPLPRSASARMERIVVPTIVFHGDRDTTVHPCNGDEVIAQARFSSSQAAAASKDGRVHVERGRVAGGREFSRKIHFDESGRCDAEHWVVHGAGHAWSGGSPKGSYTDPLGPDASKEMLRFFAEHPHA